MAWLMPQVYQDFLSGEDFSMRSRYRPTHLALRAIVAIIAPRDEPGWVHVADQTRANSAKFPAMEHAFVDHIRS